MLWIDRFNVANLVDIPRRRFINASAVEGFKEVGYLLAQMQAFRTQKDVAVNSKWEAEAMLWSQLARSYRLYGAYAIHLTILWANEEKDWETCAITYASDRKRLPM